MRVNSLVRSNYLIKKKLSLVGSTLGAVGVVYGDIGTSPLYAMNELFFGSHGVNVNSHSVLGSVSLVFWTLTLLISIKYLILVLNADHDGEGGVFALYSQLHKFKTGCPPYLKVLLMLAAGLLLGEGVITPAMSVLSSVEGLVFIKPEFVDWVVPLSLGILAFLFYIQKQGSHRMGRLFGPMALIWFLVIGGLGLRQIFQHPEILASLNPLLGLQFLMSNAFIKNIYILSSVLLVVTGGEAIFADMGHFGKTAIRCGWFVLVYPCLVFNYLGQGAWLLGGPPVSGQNLFYSMVPSGWMGPMILLATMATVIASQALISGAFSLISQAIGLGLFPRLKIIQTHSEFYGQIYIPVINLLLFIGAVSLVLIFRSSRALAALYGFSMLSVMLTTSITLMAISWIYWRWKLWQILFVFGAFASIEFMLLFGKSANFFRGGYIPALIGLFIFTIMRIWRWGRKATYRAYSHIETIKISDLIKSKDESVFMIDRNVVFMVPKPILSIEDRTPALVQFFLQRYQVLPRHVIFVEVVHRKTPYVHSDRIQSRVLYRSSLKGSIMSVTVHFGFMEKPNVEQALEGLALHHQIELPSDPHKWLVHVSHEYLQPPKSMPVWKYLRFRIFLILRQITQPAYYYYHLGRDVNLTMEIMPVKIS